MTSFVTHLTHSIVMASYREARVRALRRDDHRCRRCSSTAKPLTIHHIKPRCEGGTDWLDNLITLCSPCHFLWHEIERSYLELDFENFLRRRYRAEARERQNLGSRSSFLGKGARHDL